jgi:hypothetical protein
MNLDHLKAILATGHSASKSFVIDGKLVATNGHIAVVVPDDFDLEDKAFDKLEPVWRKALANESHPVELGEVGKPNPKYWYRKIGPCMVNETFVRALGSECEWSVSAHDKPLVVRSGGVVVAVVMPVRTTDLTSCVEPTDEDLFAPLACEANGFYLISNPEIKERIADRQKELDGVEDRIGEPGRGSPGAAK